MAEAYKLETEKIIEGIEVEQDEVIIHYREKNGLRDEISIVIEGADPAKIPEKVYEKMLRIAELIEEIAVDIDFYANNASDVYVYPDDYTIEYTIRFDGAKIMRIKHRTWWDDA